LYRWRLGDCMSSSFRGHRLPQSVAPVSHQVALRWGGGRP
jgi:hypothetical protein